MEFPKKVNSALSDQGRTKKWLAEQMGITYVALHGKLSRDCFSISERYLITNILGLGGNNGR